MIRFSVLYTLKTRLAQRIIMEQKNADVDALTGCGNRRAYIKALDAVESGAELQGLTYLTVDINGLKEVNDTLGHDEGDKLIFGTARCLEQCFGEKGHVFRIGGDEFFVLMKEGDLMDLVKAYEARLQAWSEEHSMALATSCGYARAADYPEATILELAKIADREMLQAKTLYYLQNGKERRRQTERFSAAGAGE